MQIGSIGGAVWPAGPLARMTSEAQSLEPTPPAEEDELSLSTGARILMGPVEHAFQLGGAGGPIYVEDVRAQHRQHFEELQNTLKQRFAQRGIDTSSEIRLKTAADGRVVVAGNHPQRDEIEQIFADDSALRNNFVRVDSEASFLRAADEATAFQRAYRKDPTNALEAFSHLFGPRENPTFTLSILNGQFQTLFEERP